MGLIEITTEPHELVIDGTTILMQADPTAGKAWTALLDTGWSFKTKAAQTKSITELTDALSALAHTPEDADTLRKLELGLPTLVKVTEGYVRAVTGFPT
jgi:hypothetical protein